MAEESGMGPADLMALMKNGKGGGMAAWFLLILFLFAGVTSGGGLFGGGRPPVAQPAAQAVDATVQRGFDQAALTGAIGGISRDVTGGINGLQQGLTQQLFNMQTALSAQGNAQQAQITNGMNGLVLGLQQLGAMNQQGQADIKSTIIQENCSDRNSVNNGIRDLMAQGTLNTQQIVNAVQSGIQGIQDKLCDLNKETLLQENANLRQQNQFLALQASQQGQTAAILQALSPRPTPVFTVPNPVTGTTGGSTST